MKNIRSPKNRILIMLYPVIGILNSIFGRYGKIVEFFLYFVELSPISSKIICFLLQIFNRNNLSPYNLLDCKSEIKLNAYLAMLKDEILIIDVRVYEEEENYKKKKIRRQIQKISNIMTGKEELAASLNGTVVASLVTISTDRLLDDM